MPAHGASGTAESTPHPSFAMGVWRKAGVLTTAQWRTPG